MKKRGTLLALTGLIVLAGVYAYMVTRPHATPQTYAKAKAATTTAKCLEKDATLTLAKDERDSIELAAVSYLVDVPAGTNVDVSIASHTATQVTGSDHYPPKYGNYNFQLSKQGGNWLVTNFAACK